jgi:hypothetical protein
MRKLFTIAGLVAALALVGGTLTAAPAHAGGGGGGKKHHHGHYHHGYYWGLGGLGAGLALGYALNAYSQPQVEYVPAPVYYPYAPAYPYYYAPAPVAPYSPYAAPVVTIVP